MNHVSGKSTLLIIDDSVRERCRRPFILFFVTKYFRGLLAFLQLRMYHVFSAAEYLCRVRVKIKQCHLLVMPD